MKQIREWKITRTEQRTIRVLHVPESSSGLVSRDPNPAASQPVAEAASRRWKQLLSLVRGWSRNLAPALAVALFCGCSLYGQGSVIATMSAHEISSITSKAGLSNVNNGTVPMISRNGNRVAFITNNPNGNLDVNVINSDGSGLRQLVTSSTSASLVDISDDGSLVAWGTICCRPISLAVSAADGSSTRTLVATQGGYFFAPRISADNSKVFFVLDRDTALADNTPVTRGVWSINTNGTGLHQIISAASAAAALGLTAAQVPYFANGLDRSTDGSHIVFGVSGTPTGIALLAANTDGTQVHSILTNVQYLNDLSLSGDGTKIAYNIHLNPFPQPNQIVVKNFDGSGAVSLATNFNDDGYPMQLTSNGSQLLVGTAGRLYRTDGSGFLLLAANGPSDELTGDPPTILYTGTFAGTMNASGNRIEYLANDANNVSQIIVMDVNPASTGASPVMSNPGVSPDFVLINNQSSATETVTVTPATANLYRVSSVTVVGGVPDTGSGGTVFEGILYDDGTHGDAVKADHIFTNNGVTADSIAVLGTRIIMYRAEALSSDGKRHASELQFSPFSVLRTAPYTYTVAASTPGLTVVVDGVAYSAPQQFLWDAGDSHTLTAPSPQTYQGKTYTFNNWSDNNSQTHTITAPGANTTYTALFTGSGGGCGNSPFVGTVNTNLGVLTVIQNPNCSLTGTIPGGPTFTGTATGNTWTGTFTSPTGSGTFTFTASNGGFSGTYTYTSGSGTSGTLTATTGSTNGNCAYNFPPTSGVPTALSGAGYNNLLFTLQTAPTCTWSVAAVDGWIHILVPPPNTTITGGSGVSALLDANPSSTLSRTGTITVSWPGGSGSNLVTQGPGPSCAFTLSPAATPTNISANGGPGSFAVSATPASCLWTATTPNPTWITITDPSGPSPVNFKVAANGPYPAGTRQGYIMVQGQTYTVNQDAAAAPNAPVITAGGVTNAASYASASPPNGGVAQGSYISIFGSGLGPAAGAQAPAGSTLSPTLAGVSVKITGGSTSVDVLPTFVAGPQINAIVPSNAPLGTVALTVTYNGVTSASTPVVILPNALGIFTVGASSEGIIQTFGPTAPADQRPLNSNTNTAAPGDYGIVWATGIGANILNGQLLPDNTPPPGGQMAVPVTVTIDNIPASIPYSGRAPGFAGVDNVYFIVPAGVRSGCAIAVKIQAGTLPANNVTIAVDANHQTCTGSAQVP